MLGRQAPDDVRLYYRDVAKDGVEFRQETVTGIDPTSRRVATDAGSYDPDFLVVALGADYDMAATPGLAEGGSEYYTLAGAQRMSRRWTRSRAARSSSPCSGSRSSARPRRSRGRSSCTSTSRSTASATRCR